MEFGAFVPQGWRLDLAGIPGSEHWNVMMGVVGAIERAGYRSLWVYDHFHTVPEPTNEPTFEAWTLMASLAAMTDRVRLGQMCTSNSYRLPSYLAKVAACVDVISAGRLEVGIGAGWYEDEYRGYGYEFPKPSTRIGQLREGVEIMRRMWTEDEVDFKGEYYRLEGGICRPRPVQHPHPPFWIAGGGEKLTLRVAAEYASCTNFGLELDQFEHKSRVLEEYCRDIGRDFDEIVRSSNFNVVIGETERGVASEFAAIEERYGSFFSGERLDRVVSGLRAGGLVGTPEQVAQELRRWQEEGLDYAICYFPQVAYDLTGLELFAEEVIPELV